MLYQQPRETSTDHKPRETPSLLSCPSSLPHSIFAAPLTFSSLDLVSTVHPHYSLNVHGGAGHNRSSRSKARTNQKQKCWKVRQSPSCCSLGKDISMDRVSILSKRALIGKFFYAKVPKARLSVWIQDFWKPVLGYCSRVSLVSNY
jgi:hypothetical protein